jgi:hypothetical protein
MWQFRVELACTGAVENVRSSEGVA